MKKPKKQQGKPVEGYPLYPEDQDIYKHEDEVTTLDPDNMRTRTADTDPQNLLRGGTMTTTGVMGSDLDVPGSELDDTQEDLGSEDEENNYYSLGGDKVLDEEHPDDF